MATYFGTIKKLCPELDAIKAYCEWVRVKLYFIAIDVRAGAPTYALLRE